MIDISREHLLTITQGASELPGRPHVASLWRYRTTGCRGVKLETILVGGRRFTSREALQRFVDAVTAAADRPQTNPQANRQRAKAVNAANAELNAEGF